MLNLTQQQQKILCTLVLLLATGWLVKTCRALDSEPAPNHTLSLL